MWMTIKNYVKGDMLQMESHKGITLTFGAIIAAFVFIFMTVFLLLYFIRVYYDIRIIIQSNEQDRLSINLGEALLSSDKLAYVNDGVVQRGVLDANKIKNLGAVKSELQIPLKDAQYSILIQDNIEGALTNDHPVSRRLNVQSRTFPVAIRHDWNKTNLGRMRVTTAFGD